jgi:hypothetical protein
LNSAIGRTFAATMPTSSAQIKPFDSTANEMSVAGWTISRICMIMYIKYCGKKALQKS